MLCCIWLLRLFERSVFLDFCGCDAHDCLQSVLSAPLLTVWFGFVRLLFVFTVQSLYHYMTICDETMICGLRLGRQTCHVVWCCAIVPSAGLVA